MKQLIAMAVAVVAVGYFAADASAQCYGGGRGVSVGFGGGGFYGTPVIRSSTFYYGNSFNHGITPIYRNNYRVYPYGGVNYHHGHFGHPNHFYRGYGNHFRGGSGFGINIRF